MKVIHVYYNKEKSKQFFAFMFLREKIVTSHVHYVIGVYTCPNILCSA